MPLRKSFLIPFSLFTLALVVRLFHIYALCHSEPYYAQLLLDSVAYDQWGAEIAAGNIIGKEIFYQDPLYPYFLGVVNWIFGHNLTAAVLVQSVLGALTALFVFLLGARLADRRVGIIASILWSFHPVIIFYEGLIQKEGLSVFLAVVSMYLITAAADDRRKGGFFAGGACIALAVLTRGNLLLVIPCLLGWIFYQFRKEGALFAAMMLLGVLTVLFPVALRNKIVGNEFVLTTAQAGANFYLGNNEETLGGFTPPAFLTANPKYERKDFAAEATRLTGRQLTSSEVSRFWFRKGLAFIVERPAQYLWLQFQKVKLIANYDEINDNYTIQYYRRFSPVLDYPLAPYWLIFSAAVVGMGLQLRNFKKFSLLYVYIVSYSLSLVAFFVLSRYRLLLTPFFAVFSAVALSWIWERLAAREWSTAARAVIPLCLLSLVSTRDVRWLKDANDIAVTLDSAKYAAKKGNFEEAIANYSALLTHASSTTAHAESMAHAGLGNVYYAQRKFDLAITEYGKALQGGTPVNRALIHFRRGIACVDAGRTDEAIAEFTSSLALDPDQLGSYFELARAYERKGMLAESQKYYADLKARDKKGLAAGLVKSTLVP